MEAPFEPRLPASAQAALDIIATLQKSGHVAYLSGGCVRDLLLGREPEDFDVATDAPPERVCAIFKPTRKVGAQFGVVLVKARKHWVEVATFRSDHEYLDGRRPSAVVFGDERGDALRRDFTINGMFLDPTARRLIDYVDGRADLRARAVRAIGDPAQRLAEDLLRMLRAVRLAAKLEFEIETATRAAIAANAPGLERIASERIRQELERMLAHPARARAWQLLVELGLHKHLWPDASWSSEALDTAGGLLAALSPGASFDSAFAALLHDRSPPRIEQIARQLTLSNEQRESVLWIVAHLRDFDQPQTPSLAQVKRCMAHPAFESWRDLVTARFQFERMDQQQSLFAARIAAVEPESVQPPPFVRGDDLLARHVAQGPRYAEILEQLYTRQLNEELTSRPQALDALAELLSRDR